MISAFDNGPACITPTTHGSTAVVDTIQKIHDPAMGCKRDLIAKRSVTIDENYHSMNAVDLSDQYARYYFNFDSRMWRSRKWWHAVMCAVIERIADQAYLKYCKVAVHAEAGRPATVEVTSPSSGTRGCAPHRVQGSGAGSTQAAPPLFSP